MSAMAQTAVAAKSHESSWRNLQKLFPYLLQYKARMGWAC